MEIQVAVRQIVNEQEVPLTFEYCLTIDLAEGSRFSLERYGVCVRERNGTSVHLPSLTSSAAEIDELITLLVDNCVTPATLRDVVEDWFLSRIPAPV